MKNLYMFFFLVIPCFMQAQITLTADDLPEIGETISSADCEVPANFDVGLPGENQIYDFSMLTPTDTFSSTFMSPEGTMGYDEFQNSNLVAEAEGNYVYYELTNSELLILGFYTDTSANMTGQYLTTMYNPTAKVFEIPSTFNTNFVDSSGWQVTFPDESEFADSIRNKVEVVENILFDGYGTVITPSGTFDGLREQRISTFTNHFEFYVNGMWTGFSTTTNTDTSYNWYGKNDVSLAGVRIFDGEVVSINYSILDVQVVSPIANFNSENQGGGTYNFTDLSSNTPTSWLWDFGDGNTSTQQNPMHTYAASDTYNVCLTATNSAGSDTYCEMMTVQFGSPVANFSSTDEGGGVYSFMDLSSNAPTTWSWDFGDGNTSTEQNPQHSFSTSNTYDVCLTASNSDGSDTYCEMIEVVITSINEIIETVKVDIFPNPASHELNIHWEDGNLPALNLILLKVSGQSVLERKLKCEEINTIEIENLSTGMYFYVLRDDKGEIRGVGSVLKE